MITEVRENKCTGCGNCFVQCPLDVFRLNTRQEEIPPCQASCPAGVDIRGYNYLLKMGMVDEAVKLVREALPIPAVTGRVCFHPCESECARKDVDKAVNINALERFVADYKVKKTRALPKQHLRKAAVVGSGPAGLSAAYFLVKMGYPVTVFESMPRLGGMLRTGIPEYRLPREVVDSQIDYLADLGIEFITGTTIGKDLTIADLKEKEYRAIFFAIGNQLSRRFKIEGSELQGVYWGLDFLRDINMKRVSGLKGKVLVIGGGDVAMDAALSVVRLGADSVEIACLECKEEMPAHQVYIQLAMDEGIKISTSLGPKRVTGKSGRVTGVELVRCASVFDKDGKFNPCFDETVKKSVDADAVIFAIGQAADTTLLPEKMTENGSILADPLTLETPLAGVFAGGDAVSGPSSVVEAIASGRKAAVSMDRYLRGQYVKAYGEKELKKVQAVPKEGIALKERFEAPLRPVVERKKGFKEIRAGFTEEIASLEADRCMTCGSKAYIAYPEDCMTCYTCELKCPYDALYVHPFKEVLPYSIQL